MFLSIDGVSYDVLGFIQVNRSFKVEEDSNKGTAISGRKIRSIVGAYLSHTFTIYRDPKNVAAFDAFWDVIKAKSVQDSVQLVAADGQTQIAYEAYFTAAQQALDWRNNDTNLWGKIVITFESIEPQVVPE